MNNYSYVLKKKDKKEVGEYWCWSADRYTELYTSLQKSTHNCITEHNFVYLCKDLNEQIVKLVGYLTFNYSQVNRVTVIRVKAYT